MSCKDCKSGCDTGEGGCGPRKGRQRDRLTALIAELYPAGCWGEPQLPPVGDAEGAPAHGVSTSELLTLASELATVLKTPCYIVPGDEEDLCHYVYVLCLGREPSLLELRDEVASGQRPTLWLEADRLRERYLRISLSALTRIACVQEVALELDPSEEPTVGSDSATATELPLFRLREIPMPGVFTAGLLKRMQRTVDLLEAHGIEHLDMGLLDVEASAYGLAPGDYESRYGVPPALLNYFFYAQPVQTTTVSWLPAELRPSAQS